MRRFALIIFVALLTEFCNTTTRPDDNKLTLAARRGDSTAVRDLLARGADPNAPVGVNEWPPLMHAVHKDQLGTAAALIDGGADVNRGGPNGYTPLMMAAGYGNAKMVELLLSRGAKPELADRDGANALDVAISGVSDIDDFTLFECQTETVRTLLKARPDLKNHISAGSRKFARMKRCSGVLALIRL